MIHVLLILAIIPFALQGAYLLYLLAWGCLAIVRKLVMIVAAFMVEAFWTSKGGRVVTFAWAGIGLLYGAKHAGLIR